MPTGLTFGTCTPAAGAVFPIGNTTVTCTVTSVADDVLTTGSGTFTVNVTTTPVVNPPAAGSLGSLNSSLGSGTSQSEGVAAHDLYAGHRWNKCRTRIFREIGDSCAVCLETFDLFDYGERDYNILFASKLDLILEENNSEKQYLTALATECL